jgi:hypothetical protein
MAWLISQAMMDRYSNSHCSPVQAAESLAENCLGGEPSVQSKSTPMPQAYLLPGKTTAAWNRFPSGMMSQPLTEQDGEAVLMSYLAAFPAKTYPSREKVQASTESGQGCGQSSRESFAKYDPVSRSWRTRQLSLEGGLIEFSATWPKWGLMQRGECSARPTLDFPITGNESGFSPTPTATDGKSESMSLELVERRMNASTRGVRLSEWLHRKMIPTPNACQGHSGGRLDELGGSGNIFRGTAFGKLKINPRWSEQIMGWPTGWTSCEQSATDKFQQWQQQHGEFYQDSN